MTKMVEKVLMPICSISSVYTPVGYTATAHGAKWLVALKQKTPHRAFFVVSMTQYTQGIILTLQKSATTDTYLRDTYQL